MGVALGWGIGRVPGRGGGPDADGGRRPAPAAQGGYNAGQGGGPADSGSKARPGEVRAKPSRERLEMLAAGFRNKSVRHGRVAQINLTTEITELSVEEIAAVTGLMAAEKMGWETTELLLARWAMLDPKAALAFALGHEELSGNVMIMESIMGELAKTDPPAAKAALAQLGERQQDFSERTIVRQLLEKKNIRTALAWARELENNDAETEVLLSWSESDPLAAAAELMPGRESHQRAAAAIAEMLINKDRALFETWAKRLADPGQQAAARHVALTADANTDPKAAALAAAEWLATGPEAVARAGNLPAHIIQRWLWSGEGHAQVAAWAAGLPPPAHAPPRSIT
ncbi:MAG: hypothetical protein EOP86_24105, partial [Verrucomicrobiaceae bacterium]